MITCRLKGGLGNLMFQIAALETMSRYSGFESYYYNADQYLNRLNQEVKHNPNLKHANTYKTIFKNFKWPTKGSFKKTIKIPFHYTNIKIEDNVCYDGFFQSEKFIDRDYIQHLFYPANFIIEALREYNLEGNTCSIHVRRGDYLKFPNIHPVQDMNYYNNAMNIIKADKYFIFSDDMKWCKENFKGDQFEFVENIDYVEMFLQASCKHNIIANSSFSWWGAYLNSNNNKKVIAPKKWFGTNKYDSRDIIPESWIKL